MNRVMLLPLDERPCNDFYPRLLKGDDFVLALAPKRVLGQKKEAGDFSKMLEWVRGNAPSSSSFVLSLDQFLYGGLLPSRLHDLSLEELSGRLDEVVRLKKENPELKIYAFSLLMRCPYYSSSDEEPDYYETEGSSIFKNGYYLDIQKTRALTPEEEEDFKKAKAILKPEDLDDYLLRRKKNLALIEKALGLYKEGLFESFVVPNDDSAPFGYTANDKRSFFEMVRKMGLEDKVLNYPGADEVGMSLLGKAINEARGLSPKVYVLPSSLEAMDSIPPFEDRPLKESLPKQLLANGLTETRSAEEADFVLAINGYSEKKPVDPEKKAHEFLLSIEYLLKEGKKVAIADTAITNEGDSSFLAALEKDGAILKLLSYAGWNTSGNTLGTSLASASIFLNAKDHRRSEEFIIYQAYECLGYMGYARKKMVEEISPKYRGMDYFHARSQDGLASSIATKLVEEKMALSFPSLARRVSSLRLTFPWKRFFECALRLTFKGERP